MCVDSFFPKPPDPAPLPPAAKPDPVIDPVKPKTTPLIDPDKVAKVDYGKTSKAKVKKQPKVTADSLKINTGVNTPSTAQTGGLNVS